jgi:hypothetical protein
MSNRIMTHKHRTMAEVIFFTIMIVSFVVVMLIGYFAKRNNRNA